MKAELRNNRRKRKFEKIIARRSFRRKQMNPMDIGKKYFALRPPRKMITRRERDEKCLLYS